MKAKMLLNLSQTHKIKKVPQKTKIILSKRVIKITTRITMLKKMEHKMNHPRFLSKNLKYHSLHLTAQAFCSLDLTMTDVGLQNAPTAMASVKLTKGRKKISSTTS